MTLNCILNCPAVHRPGDADHVDIRCGHGPLPMRDGVLGRRPGGVACESVGVWSTCAVN